MHSNQEGYTLGDKGLIAIGAALAIGLPALAAAIGQGRATAAAMEGIARQPEAAGNIRGGLVLGLAFMEALALYGLVIAFFLQQKV